MSMSGSHRPDSANLLVRHKRTDWYRTRSSLACHPVGVPRSDGRRAVLSPPAPRLVRFPARGGRCPGAAHSELSSAPLPKGRDGLKSPVGARKSWDLTARAKCGQSGGDHRITATTVTPNAAVLRWTRSVAYVHCRAFTGSVGGQKEGARACVRRDGGGPGSARGRRRRARGRSPGCRPCRAAAWWRRRPAAPRPCMHPRAVVGQFRTRTGTYGGLGSALARVRITWEVGAARDGRASRREATGGWVNG